MSIINKVGWDPRPVWTRGDILPPPEFKPRTVRTVARSCTDYTVLAPSSMYTSSNNEMYKKYNTLLQASRSQCPRGLRSRSATAHLLGLRVRIPQGYECLFICIVCQGEVAASAQTLIQGHLTDCVLLTVIKCNNNPLHLTVSGHKDDRLWKKKASIASGLTVILIPQSSSLFNPPVSYVYRTLNELPRYPVTCKTAKARYYVCFSRGTYPDLHFSNSTKYCRYALLFTDPASFPVL